jgi:hypothetical protein
MLRFASRFLGFWLLAAAVVAAVVDGAKSIAASTLVTTSLGEAWSLVAGFGSGAGMDTAATAPSLPALLEIPLHWLLALPAVAVLGIAGAIFLILGAKRRPPSLSREFAA